MIRKVLKASVLGLVLPLSALADTTPVGGTGSGVPINTSFFQSLYQSITTILQYVVPIVISLAVIVFIWGVLKFVMSAGNEDARKEGRNLMIYGIIGIFVMVSVWGLVRVLQSATGLSNGSNAAIGGPQLPIPSNTTGTTGQ